MMPLYRAYCFLKRWNIFFTFGTKLGKCNNFNKLKNISLLWVSKTINIVYIDKIQFKEKTNVKHSNLEQYITEFDIASCVFFDIF